MGCWCPLIPWTGNLQHFCLSVCHPLCFFEFLGNVQSLWYEFWIELALGPLKLQGNNVKKSLLRGLSGVPAYRGGHATSDMLHHKVLFYTNCRKYLHFLVASVVFCEREFSLRVSFISVQKRQVMGFVNCSQQGPPRSHAYNFWRD